MLTSLFWTQNRNWFTIQFGCFLNKQCPRQITRWALSPVITGWNNSHRYGEITPGKPFIFGHSVLEEAIMSWWTSHFINSYSQIVCFARVSSLEMISNEVSHEMLPPQTTHPVKRDHFQREMNHLNQPSIVQGICLFSAGASQHCQTEFRPLIAEILRSKPPGGPESRIASF